MKKIIQLLISAFALSSLHAVVWNGDNDLFEIHGGVTAYWYQTFGSVNGFVADPDYSFNTKYWSNNGTQASITFYSNWGDVENRYKLGSIHGSFFDNEYHFGFKDAHGYWTFLSRLDDYVEMRVSNVAIMRLEPSPSGKRFVKLESLKPLEGAIAGINMYSNSPEAAYIKLFDGTDTPHGSIIGALDGAMFGLKDKNSKWVFRARPNDKTEILVGDTVVLTANSDGTTTVNPGGDLSMGSFTQKP